MNKEKEEEVYKMALAVFPPEHQIICMIEECAELQKELVKYLRGKPNPDHILEEMADVDILLNQMKAIFGARLFRIAKVHKLKRLEKRLLEGDMEALK